MVRNRTYLWAFIGAVLMLMVACVKDSFNFKKMGSSYWKPDVAVPLVNSSLSLQDILILPGNSSIFNVGADNFVTLIYNGTLFSLRADDFIRIPDQLLEQTYNPGPAEIALLNALPPGDTVSFPPFSQLFDFQPGDSVAYIDSSVFRNGVLTFAVKSSLQHDISLYFEVPGAVKNGSSLKGQVLVPPAGASPVQTSASFSLSNYHIRFFEGAQKNKVRINFKAKLTRGGNDINASDFIEIKCGFSSLYFASVFGNIGQQHLAPYTDTVSLGLFDNVFGNSSFTLAEGAMKIKITNAFGIPIEARFSRLQGYAPQNVQPNSNIYGAQDPLPIPLPAQIGQSATSSFTLSPATGSNILSVLGQAPRQIIYKIDAVSNPAVSQPHENFLEDTSRFKVDMEIELPLHGAIQGLTFQDTIQFKFEDIDQLESLGLRSFIENGFPLSMDVQVYFADSLGIIVDSLMTTDRVIVSAAPVGSNGRVTSKTNKTTDINYPNEKIVRLGKVRQIFVRGKTQTVDNGTKNVKIYSDYRLSVKLSARAKLKFKI